MIMVHIFELFPQISSPLHSWWCRGWFPLALSSCEVFAVLERLALARVVQPGHHKSPLPSSSQQARTKPHLLSQARLCDVRTLLSDRPIQPRESSHPHHYSLLGDREHSKHVPEGTDQAIPSRLQNSHFCS